MHLASLKLLIRTTTYLIRGNFKGIDKSQNYLYQVKSGVNYFKVGRKMKKMMLVVVKITILIIIEILN